MTVEDSALTVDTALPTGIADGVLADPVPAPTRARIRPQPKGALFRRFNRLGSDASLTVGAGILILYVLLALVSLVWTPYDPRALSAGAPYASPTLTHLFGTDRLGTDVLSRCLAACRLDLFVVVVAVAISLVVGSVIGTIAGYFGRWSDGLIMRLLEVFQAFPAFLLAMLLVQATGPGVLNVVIVLALVGVPDYLRLARAGVMARRGLPIVEAARLAGAGSYRIAFRHLLPNSFGPLLAQTSVNAGWAVLLTSSLGFLGIGIPANIPEWGAMIATGRDGIVLGQWWMSLFPGLLVFGLAGGLYLLGDGLADVLDKRRRS
jgi:peptide/nickel transport system permease protein